MSLVAQLPNAGLLKKVADAMKDTACANSSLRSHKDSKPSSNKAAKIAATRPLAVCLAMQDLCKDVNFDCSERGIQVRLLNSSSARSNAGSADASGLALTQPRNQGSVFELQA